MNRQTFNALCAQYATPKVSGDGLVSWDGGKKCVIPSLTLYGAVVQDGEPTPENPVMPVCNNGVFASRGRNLAAIATVSSGYWLDGTGLPSDPDARFVCLSVNVLPNALYTLSSSLKIYSIWYVNQSGTPVARTNVEAYTTAYKTPDDCVSLRISLRNTSGVADTSAFKWLQCEFGDTATPYTPYYDGGQAQAPELWAADGVADEWDAVTGKGVRRVLALRITGEMLGSNFLNGRIYVRDEYSGRIASKAYNARTALCTHFSYNNNVYRDSGTEDGFIISLKRIFFRNMDWESAEDAIDWFSANEVYVYAEASTPEPFYHPPAKLTMPTGYGQIIQTSGDVPDCPITARYLTHS